MRGLVSIAFLLAACGSHSLPAPASVHAAYTARVLLAEVAASALAIGPDGTIYFAANESAASGPAANGSIRYLKPGTSAAQTLAGSAGPAAIAAVALDPKGTLYITRTSNAVASQNAVYRYEQDHFVLVAGGGSSAEPRGSATDVLLQGPVGLAFFPDGQMVIAEYGDNRVLRVSSSGTVETFVGTGECPAGSTPPADGRASNIAICGPWSLAIDSESNLYVASYESDWILRVDPSGRARALSGFGRVTALADAREGSILVADVGGRRILRLDSRQPIAVDLAAPRALAIAPSGNVLVATELNRQIIELVRR